MGTRTCTTAAWVEEAQDDHAETSSSRSRARTVSHCPPASLRLSTDRAILPHRSYLPSSRITGEATRPCWMFDSNYFRALRRDRTGDLTCVRRNGRGEVMLAGSRRAAMRSSTRRVAFSSRALTRLRVALTAASTVPGAAALMRVPRRLSRRIDRRRSAGSASRTSHPRSMSRCRMPVKVLGWRCSTDATWPADTPGKSSTTRRTSRCGPVMPRSRLIRFDVFSRACTRAHSNCMNCRTRGNSDTSTLLEGREGTGMRGRM